MNKQTTIDPNHTHIGQVTDKIIDGNYHNNKKKAEAAVHKMQLKEVRY